MLPGRSTTPSMHILEVFDQITWGALACVGLVLMIWLYQALKFRNRALALES